MASIINVPSNFLVCVRNFLEMTYICKLGEDQKKSFHPELEWFLSSKLGEDHKRKEKKSSPRIGAVFVPKKFIAQCKNMSVRTKFMRVRSL